MESAVAAVCHPKPDLASVRGTGFFVSPAGWLATADHVVAGAPGGALPDLFVLRNSPQGLAASKVVEVRRLRSSDAGRDIAFVRIARDSAAPPLPFLEFGEPPATGDAVLVAGFPLVFDRVYRWPLFRWGRVASDRYHLREAKVLVLDLTSAAGFSGSPVVRPDNGRVAAVLKGKATGNEAADFSVGTILTPADLPQ